MNPLIALVVIAIVLVMAVKLSKFSDNNSEQTATPPSPTETSPTLPPSTSAPIVTSAPIIGFWKVKVESNAGGVVFPCTAFKFSENEEVTCYLLSPLVPAPKIYGKYTIDNQTINFNLNFSDEIPEVSRLMSNIDGEYKIKISNNIITLNNDEITIFLEKPETPEPTTTPTI